MAKSFEDFPLITPSAQAKLKRSALKRRPPQSSVSKGGLGDGSRTWEKSEQACVWDGQAGSGFIAEQVPRRRKVLMAPWHVCASCSEAALLSSDFAEVTISVVTLNSSATLEDFLDSLLRQNYPLKRLNLVFADRGSDDDTVEKLTQFVAIHANAFAGIHIEKEIRPSIGASHDKAIRASSSELVLLASARVRFHASSISRLVATSLVDDPDVAGWESRQYLLEKNKFYDPVTLESPWFSHVCVLIKRSAYLMVDGYVRRGFLDGEDMELSYRLRSAGYRLRVLPKSVITNFGTSTPNAQEDGSRLAASVLLRYAYCGKSSGEQGELNLSDCFKREKDRQDFSEEREKTFAYAFRKIAEHKAEFIKSESAVGCRKSPTIELGEYDVERGVKGVELSGVRPRTDWPLVSIVSRTHGCNLGMLGEAIVSVINQSHPNIEHVIVEDKTDFAKDYVSRIKEVYGVNIAYHKSEGGVGAGRSIAGNLGLSKARGEYLMLLDFDDLLMPDHVESLVSSLLEQRENVAAYAGAWTVPTYYSASGEYREGPPSIHMFPYERGRFLKTNFIPIQAILFRRRLFEKLGGFDTSIDHLEDWNLWARYEKEGNFVLIPKLTSLFRIPGDPEFKWRREEVMRLAHETVRLKTFGGTPESFYM